MSRLLFVAMMLLAGLASVAPGAQAAVPDKWGFAVVDVTSGVPDPNHQAGSWAPGFTVSVSPGVAGQTFVRFPQIATAGGVVHVTAISQNAHWCQAQKWGPSGTDLMVAVQCYRYGGAPVFTPYSVLFETSSGTLPAPKAFGYVHYNGAAVVTQFNSAGAANVVAGGGGVWTVTLPGLGSTGPAGNLQVTAVDPNQPARCKVGGWSSAPGGQTVQVRCHNATSAPLNTGWTLTYQRERSVIGAALPPNNFAYTFDNSPANPGPYAPLPAPLNYNSLGGVNTVQTAGTGQRLIVFPAVGVLQDHVQVTAYGTGPEFCNLGALWNTSGNAIVRNVICYNATTRVDRTSLVSYTSAF
ncbi:hypothetical protein FHS43_002583 [Streptosporangium becharense]|uniref:Uncharacterized protein n=1 Tax=Streptosporangium becharense TaxID=1816182 RepID=A0A7W9MIN1_9ACTN|nr:hypothetical protein [Streptosporangium becharense]MBB2911318.1 hypothetical protein [Streptosporangium becharense]MBB5821624.1 hypothetical protein [Streptosporangium becharense]